MKARLVIIALLTVVLPALVFAQAPSIAAARQTYEAGDVEGAIKTIDAVIAAQPRDYLAHQYKGIFTRALARKQKSRQLYLDAIAAFEQALALDAGGRNKVITLGNIGSTHVELGDYAAAETVYEECRKVSDRAIYTVFVAQCRAKRGMTEGAIALVAGMTRDAVVKGDSASNEGLTAYNLGLVYVYCNRSADAVRWLRLAVELNASRFRPSIEHDPELDPIRASPEFMSLIRKS
ncbi:MAG: tetratricopeptide repeat protein [Blastocatellia bacterium]|nr:tetratricopeptide repeat protein [Blastocatellia bacterium]MBK6425889.1 tetratricopeptide repeat protein [Blastocatellia bacterium]